VLATLSHDPAQAPWIFTILLIYQWVVVNVLMPKLLSDALGLHPLIIMAALLGGVKIGGFWGAVFAVPVAGVIATMTLFFYRRAKRTDVPGSPELATTQQTAPSTVAPTEASPEKASLNSADVLSD
jgi:predicted PurR-regulated permease PerM